MWAQVQLVLVADHDVVYMLVLQVHRTRELQDNNSFHQDFKGKPGRQVEL